jgi:hypothetical protein
VGLLLAHYARPHTEILTVPGRDLILPNLAHLRDRSLIVCDPKDGENAFVSAAHRRDTLGHKVKRERVTDFAQRSFERCKDQWAAKNYDRLLKREGNAPSLQPSFAVNDRKAHLMRAAGNLALQRHHKNVARINRVADRMVGRKRDELGR